MCNVKQLPSSNKVILILIARAQIKRNRSEIAGRNRIAFDFYFVTFCQHLAFLLFLLLLLCSLMVTLLLD
ncbi:uncharacterized protein BJX67DRAFT_367239 [Aspergillus lucknowensis]|uniref:Uncharacterized protein n=1 Tax=Aspergillus lucknowensis TaxID=176173 RepID=A0ABR4L995_9EURO